MKIEIYTDGLFNVKASSFTQARQKLAKKNGRVSIPGTFKVWKKKDA